MTSTVVRLRASDIADDLGCCVRDVIDIAHESGVVDFENDGAEIEYADLDRFDERNFNRGLDSLNDVEFLVDADSAVAERLSYLLGVEL